MTISHPSNVDLDEIPSLPRSPDGPVFAAPWEAQAFAITLELHRRGLFTWSEWANALALEIEEAAKRKEWDDGTRYYARWLAALEKLVAAKHVVHREELENRMVEWDEAAKATPHGKPISLKR